MDLLKYDEKHVRVDDIYGDTFEGVADFFCDEYCMHEFGVEEDAIIINGYLIYESQVASIEEIEVHGTAELRTEHMILRRFCLDDAPMLHKEFGTNPEMYRYSGWNPFATEEMALNAVHQFIDGYNDEHCYNWVMDFDDVLFGIIGAYDFKDDSIEVGFSVIKPCWGRGYATEALQTVLEYLTENEGISRVTAWCASDNTGSKRVLEKAGMSLVRIEKDGLAVGDKTYDKLFYEYNAPAETHK